MGTLTSENKSLIRKLQDQVNSLSNQPKAPVAPKKTTAELQAGDIQRGKDFASDTLGPEGLGRLGTDTGVQDTLSKFKDIADNGLSRQEVGAERAQAFRSIDSNTQTTSRSLQAKLAKMGVKGATAGQQLIQAELAGSQQKSDASTNLFLKSESLKRDALKDFSSRQGEIKSFDLGQAAKEKDITLQAGLGFAQLGSSERTANFAAEQSKAAQVASAKASKPSCFLGSNSLLDNKGKFVNFENLEPGNILKDNNLVLGVSKHLALDNLYFYKGVYVTGDHFVFEDFKYIKVKHSTYASEIEYPMDTIYVYNVITEKGIIEIKDIIFSDWNDDEIEGSYGKVHSVYKGKVRTGDLGK